MLAVMSPRLLLLPAVIIASIMATDRKRSFELRVFARDKVLNGYALAELHQRSMLACALLCLHFSKCVSINFKPPADPSVWNCNLNSRLTKTAMGDGLTASPGASYIEVKKRVSLILKQYVSS